MDNNVKTKQFYNMAKNVWGNAREFFKKNYALFLAPIIVFVLYMVSLFAYDVFPFGDKYTASSYDLSAQIAPFIEHLFDVMQGKSTLTYSYAIVGGADVTGTFLYFFISPFSFLFLLFGDGKVLYASSIVMVCKLMTIAFVGAWFAKKVFEGIPNIICVAIGCVYAFCGYTFVSNTYINWMDFLIYLPFCVATFKHFVKTGKFLPFSILMACCIYTCFSIACFSMFTVFPALVAYALLCVEKGNKKKFIADLCLSFLVTILIALPVLLPALASYLSSARGGDLFENLWNGYTVSKDTGVLESFNSSEFLDDFSTSLYKKVTYIISDAAFVTLTLFWLVKKGFKDPLVKFMLVAGGMTLLPVFVDEAMNLMNMGSYMSYSLRFGFLNATYFLGGACLAIEDLCADHRAAKHLPSTLLTTENIGEEGGMAEVSEENPPVKKAMLSMEKEKKSKNICAIIFIAVSILSLVAMIWLTSFDGYREIWSYLADIFSEDKKAINSALNNYASRFAHSLGGLEVIVFPVIVVSILTCVGAILLSMRKVPARIVSFALIVVVAFQVSFYSDSLVLGNRSTQHEPLSDYQTLTQTLNERDDSYFRIKDYNDKWTAVVPFSGGSNSFSVFSSIIDADNFITYQLFGYQGNGKNSFKSAHNDGKTNRTEEFGDAFLGYKYFYFYTDPNDKDATVKEQLATLEKEKTYLKKVKVKDENGVEKHLKSGNFYVYENTIVFPLGYRVNDGEFRFEKENTNNSTNRRLNQAKLYEFLRGENLKDFTDSIKVTPKSAKELSEYLWGKSADVTVGAGKITAKVTAKEGEALFLNFVASQGYSVTVNGKKAELIDNDLHFLSVALEEGENVVVFTYSSPYVKYMGVGFAISVVGLLAVAFVLKRTKIMQYIYKYIAWAGIALALALVAFFMLFPTGVFIRKWIEVLLGLF